MSREISHKIQEFMRNEFGEMGENILRKQCVEIGIMPDEISVADLEELSDSVFNAVRYFMGMEKARKVKEGIRRYILLQSLWDLESLEKDDIRAIKECKLRLELGGIALDHLGDFEGAFGYFSRAAELAENMGRKDLQATAMKGIGFTELERCHIQKARAVVEMALELCEDDGLCETMAESKRALALCHWRNCEYDAALGKLMEVKEIYQELGDKIGVAFVYKNLGDLYGEKEDFDESISYYKKSAELYGNNEQYAQRATLFMNMGVSYSIIKDWPNAAKYYRLSEDIARKNHLPNILAWVLFNLGEAYTYLNEFEKAEKVFGESRGLFENQHDTVGQAGVHIKYGQMCVEKRLYHQAVPHLEKGIELLRVHYVPRYMADAVHELGKAKARMGEGEEARKLYHEAMRIYKLINNISRVKMVERDLEMTKSLK